MRHRAARDIAAAPYVPSLALAVGYLAEWLAFSVSATALQSALVGAQLISGTMLWSESAMLSAGVLLLAGAYQLSPLNSGATFSGAVWVEISSRESGGGVVAQPEKRHIGTPNARDQSKPRTFFFSLPS